MILKICAATVMINLSEVPWTDFDYKTKDRAVKTCRIRYKSCLKKFVKKEKTHYNAICRRYERP